MKRVLRVEGQGHAPNQSSDKSCKSWQDQRRDCAGSRDSHLEGRREALPCALGGEPRRRVALAGHPCRGEGNTGHSLLLGAEHCACTRAQKVTLKCGSPVTHTLSPPLTLFRSPLSLTPLQILRGA